MPTRRWCAVTVSDQMAAAVESHRGTAAADRLCELCVELLDVDAAAISLIFDGTNSGTLGVSSAAARTFDEVQFTVGEGPCLQSVADRGPVLVPDLGEPGQVQWPMYTPVLLELDVRSVHALPIVLAGEYLGALDLFRHRTGPLSADQLVGALAAAALAELPLLDLLAEDLQETARDPDSTAWAELNSMFRVEVNQATGMLVGQLDVDPGEALVRLRAHAYATGRSATAVARDILDRRLRLEL